ncbi:extracellular solute-binding protein [Phyllobacterium endophyticum]|uniref:ABC transporter substrate-binding protein n=1 Tax=Phyllobacterium endophyticum TaxID=1149773 RepID=A0A2P7AVR7_9HYPH|nr:peptide/nickel transport system substrate-binding protein [Phyllobacterium endophyticum]PSH58283.1 ABC transporter substrate-binding protein [Phyllobacterium endophyticum]TYR38966.1 ABC transporter substrate-binding protein [Phyllobacterium endophyticum]
MLKRSLQILALLLATCSATGTSHAEPTYGLAMHGEPALAADYKAFPYVNPDAPKEGSITYGVVGTFESLNPFLIKSMRTTARGMFGDSEFGNLVYESLMQRTADEPFTVYGLLAEKVETNDERTWVEFTLNPKARWSDGQPVTPDDVIFTFDLLTKKGRPPFSNRMKLISKIEKIGERGIRFTFNEQANREFPLVLALMPVLPKHAIDSDKFDASPLAIPVGSGPYIVSKVQPGQRIILKRNPDYWASELPSRVGFNNFDTITVEYFRNDQAQFEAFKKGVFDVFMEGDPNKWATSYDFPAVKDGRVIKESFRSRSPANMFGFVFNTRRPLFQNKDVREALALMFDFEWTNRNLYAGRYQRLGSYWQGSELSALGKPADATERALLSPYPGSVPPDVMDGTYEPARTDGTGRDRKEMKRAYDILVSQGYRIQNEQLLDPRGIPLAFEILTRSVGEERLGLAYKRTLERLGIAVNIRTVDDAQYQKRLQTFDYDVILGAYSSSLSPGYEQFSRWGSQSKEVEGSFNFAGVADPVIDMLLDKMLSARGNEEFTSVVRALDRVLISGHYMVPIYYQPEQWVARWAHLQHPDKTSLIGNQLNTWWSGKR